MCWVYEDKYNRCFDYLFFDGEDDSLVILLEGYGVEMVDRNKFELEFLEMLTKLHDNGVIRPMKKDPERAKEGEIKNGKY